MWKHRDCSCWDKGWRKAVMSDRKRKLLEVVYVCFCLYILVSALYLESVEKTSCFLFPTMKKTNQKGKGTDQGTATWPWWFCGSPNSPGGNDTRRDSQGELRASHLYPSSEASLPESWLIPQIYKVLFFHCSSLHVHWPTPKIW